MNIGLPKEGRSIVALIDLGFLGTAIEGGCIRTVCGRKNFVSNEDGWMTPVCHIKDWKYVSALFPKTNSEVADDND